MQQRSRLLNATTSPNALIREAVLASCAIPGMFPAVTLAAPAVITADKTDSKTIVGEGDYRYEVSHD